MSKTKLSNREEFPTNTFIEELGSTIKLKKKDSTVLSKNHSLIDKTTGEIIDLGTTIGTTQIVDSTQFYKIYCRNIRIEYNLSTKAEKLFYLLATEIDYNNCVYFDCSKDFQKIGYKSKVTCYQALKELLDKQILRKRDRINQFWVNPILVCKSDRYTLYKRYLKREKGSSE